MLDKRNLARENDPREDILLTKVSADLTTGGLVQHRVSGNEATFSQSRNLLVFKDVAVNTYASDGTIQGVTRAELGQVFLAPDPALQRNQNDMRFAGNVRYSAPNRDHPETDTLQLSTEQLIYDDALEEFQGVSTHSVVMMPPGKRPLYMQGSKLRVPRDMSRFSMLKGSVGPVYNVDSATSYAQAKRELEIAAQQAFKGAERAPVRPTPIQVPEDPGTPEKPEMPNVPAMAPSPTPVPPSGLLRKNSQ